MSAELYMRKGDTQPDLRTKLTTASGEPLAVEAVESIKAVISRVNDKGQPEHFLTKDAAAVPEQDGVWGTNWESGDTDVPGDYVIQWHVKYTDNEIQTYPTLHHNTLTIMDSVSPVEAAP